MGTTVAELNSRVTADVSDLEREFLAGQRAAEKFGRSMAETARRVSNSCQASARAFEQLNLAHLMLPGAIPFPEPTLSRGAAP